MTIYLAMIDDCHTDTAAYPFDTAQAAIDYARTLSIDFAESDEDKEESLVDGWLYQCRDKDGGSSVWVIPRTLNEP